MYLYSIYNIPKRLSGTVELIHMIFTRWHVIYCICTRSQRFGSEKKGSFYPQTLGAHSIILKHVHHWQNKASIGPSIKLLWITLPPPRAVVYREFDISSFYDIYFNRHQLVLGIIILWPMHPEYTNKLIKQVFHFIEKIVWNFASRKPKFYSRNWNKMKK